MSTKSSAECSRESRVLSLVFALPLLLGQVQLLGLHRRTEFRPTCSVRLYKIAGSTYKHREHDGNGVGRQILYRGKY